MSNEEGFMKIGVLLCAAMAVMHVAAASDEVAFAPNVQPAPVRMEVESNTLVRLDRSQSLTVACADGSAQEAAEWVESRFEEWLRFTKTGWLFSRANAPRVCTQDFSGSPLSGGDEAYELEARPAGVVIRANAIQGVRYALYTLRQTMIPMPRDGRTTAWYAMPALKVCDSPALKFRGIHIPWTIKTTVADVEKWVRLSAYLKFNYAVIEPWGTFRSERHPWWGWKEGTMTPSAVRRIVRIGKTLGITLVPQIPAFGHASMGITSPGRHAVLDAHGEYAPLFESLNGWNWCLSNPETLKVQFELIDELMELFERPPYFHIGCDEAAKPNCPRCRASNYRALVVRHILALHVGLKARGAKTMLWHDMFIKAGDRQWEGFTANGTDETVEAFKSFPRDIVVCDWIYSGEKGAYPTLAHFAKMGFNVLACPWHNRGGTLALGAAARELGILGMLVTSWGDGQGKQRGKVVSDIFSVGASAAWGTPYVESDLWKWGYDLDFIRNLRDVEHDMNLEGHDETGTYRD